MIAEEVVSTDDHGEVGRHDWCIGGHTEDGYLVFVDDRPLCYRATKDSARKYAMDIIARLQADGDYRLNDRPPGFFPPPLLKHEAK